MISLLITLIIVGFILWGVETFIPMDPQIKRLIQAVVVICAFLYVLNAFGLLPAQIKIP